MGYKCAKYLADIVIPQEYGITKQEKLAIGQGICTPLLKKIRADLQRNIGEEDSEDQEESIYRLNPIYSHGVSSPGRHVRTRLYFTSESHIHSLLTVLRFGGLLDNSKDEQWHRAMDYVGAVSELNYLSQIVIMLYEDPTKDPTSESRFHVELHFSPGVNCCVHKNLPVGPGFRPKSRNEPPLSPKAEAEMRRNRAISRVEEEDMFFLEDPDQKKTEVKNEEQEKKDCENKNQEYSEVVDPETNGSGADSICTLEVDSTAAVTPNVKISESKCSNSDLGTFLSPPSKIERGKYSELPQGVMPTGGSDESDVVVPASSEPIPISTRSHSDCGLMPVGLQGPYPISR